jgi:four helix bundle protein
MLQIYTVVLEVTSLLRPIIDRIERNDRDLAKQMRRALASVALNTSEGAGSQGRNRRARYFNALGSQKETRACLDVATALGYITPIDHGLDDKLDHITAVLWRVSH